MDIVADLAQPFPAIIIAELFGIAEADRPRFQQWADVMAKFFGGVLGNPKEAAHAANPGDSGGKPRPGGVSRPRSLRHRAAEQPPPGVRRGTAYLPGRGAAFARAEASLNSSLEPVAPPFCRLPSLSSPSASS